MRWTTGLFAVLFLIAAIRSAPLQRAEGDDEDDPSRLPKSSQPISYAIQLTTNVHTGERAFTGEVTIEIKIVNETDTITLHNNGLTAITTRLYGNGIDDVAHTTSSDTSRNFFFITADRTLLVDELYTIHITYSGQLQTSMNGFYLSSYRIGTETRYLASTQFQSTGARYSFFCYDEPEFKAEFGLTITHATDYSAISNTIGAAVNNGDGTTTTSFPVTPIMSSYLLAFVVSDFDYSTNEEGLAAGETIQRVYARPDEKQRTEYALDSSIKFLKQLESWADYEYELPKMFSAAIPDFAAGAMENWGLITYKEQYLILEEASHPREKFDSLRVIAHELGHQFFGNVVTCKWWNYIWLNEGYATVFEYLLVDRQYPELRMNELFSIINVQGAFRPDSLESSHPMTYNGQTQSLIIYNKAGSVIRMFQYALGDELFARAMKYYLEENHHKPVTSDDLYAAVEVVLAQTNFEDFDFTRAFRTWENQKGYPLVHVTADYDSNQFRVTQQRYLALTDKNEEDNTQWYIPLNYVVASSPQFDDTTITNYFLEDQTELTIPHPPSFASDQWFVFNKQQIGYYRVNYDNENWQQLIRTLNSDNFKDIHVSNRAQLIDDALNLAADEYLDYNIAFGILSYLERETDYIPWRAVVTNLDKLDYLIASDSSLSNNFQRFVRKLARLMYITYGLEEAVGSTMVDQFARELAIDWTCRMGDERCLRDTYDYLRRITHEGLVVPKSLETTFMCNGLRASGRQDEFNVLWNRMLDSNDQSERIRIIDGLVCSSDSNNLHSLLLATIAPNAQPTYRAHEITRIWSNIVSKSFIGIDTMIDFIDQNYDDIRTWSGSQSSSTINSLSQRISRSADQLKLTNLIDRLVARPTNPLSADARTRALDNMQVNAAWIASEKFARATNFVNEVIGVIDAEQNQLILPKTSEPRHYNIHITATNIPTGGQDFSGEIEIDALVKVTTDRIIIHSREQTVLDVQAFNKNGMTPITVYDFSRYEAAHTLTIYFLNEIPAETEIILRIKYEGIMQTAATNYGFHISSYVHEGQTRYMGVTQFESSLGSRFAFPHYDEPRYKATFQLTLTHSSSHHAISNTLGTAVENGVTGTTTTTFVQTPRMSSYLLAFIISDLESVTNADTIGAGETLHRIWVRPDSTSKAWFALQSADSGLKALESYLNFDFALPKMDSAGVPGKNGAMENWGLITYWESSMIYQENYEDITHALKFSGVNVILHETAHQFFGNAATFEWWDYLWLSEGFATLLSYQITDDLHPDWQQRHFFNIRELQNAFRYDSNVTRSMTPTPSLVTPAEIRSTFDPIAYDKSGSVIRMFQNAVGEDIFRASLTQYLTDNEFQSAIPQNLYDAFQATMNAASFTEFDFAVAFRTWEQQKGYPVIHCTYSNGQFEIRQERYFIQKPATSNDTSNWYIPLNFAIASNPNFDDTRITNYFNNGLPTTTIPAPSSFDTSQWFIFNKQQLGYYRVNYDADNWHAIILALNSRDYANIHVLNRVQLIDDAVNFASGGYITYDVLFGLMQYLSRETEYTPWYSADRFISLLYTAFGPFNADLNSYVRHLSQRMYSSYKLPSTNIIPVEEVYERYGREIATRLACNAGNEECLEDTANVLRGFIDSGRQIPKGLESVVLCNSFKTANSEEWSIMWSEMRTTSDTTFRSQILSGLGCSRNSTLLQSYLESTIDSENTFSQAERRNVLSSVLNSNVGLQAVINFIRDFRLDIMSYYSYTLEEMILVPARTVKTRAQQTLFNNFLQTLTDLGAEATGRVNTIVENNFVAQQQSFYPDVMAMVQSASENQLRLPRTSEPRHYTLHLDARNIPSGNRAFTGEIEIQTVVTEPTDRIVIHSKTQIIDELHVFRGANELELIEYHLYPEADTLTIYFVDYVVTNDELTIHIKYSTNLVDGATGFYQTSYTINGQVKYLGATQFESTGGRYCFPHYDEPGLKATFDLSITHDTGHTAIANTLSWRVENGDGTATTSFGTSPVMSSYLLAFVVSDLEYVDNEDTMEPGGTLHRVWVRPDSLDKAWYAVEASDRVLQALEEYTGFDYELPKVDSAGVPNKGGAMENWGMVTYRENAMIYEVNYEDISHSQKWSGVGVIAHELAHQFFGDSVTCEWWDTIWLNEGFATLFEYHLVGMLYPEWRVKDMFNLRTLQNVMRNDARGVTRPMTKPLLTPAEISGAFDYVVYAKAGSVLRMFQYTLGEDIFRAALRLYLNTNNHKAINSQPLVDAFRTEMANQGLNNFDFDVAFRSWELQAGYPVIHVSYMEAGQFQITQQRFYTLSNESLGDPSSWYIPLNFATASNPNFDDTSITNYFVNGNNEYRFDPPSQFESNQWFIFNKQQLGYYRVNYDLQNWNALSNVLNSDDYGQIHVLNRAQLIDDALSFAQGNYLEYDVLLELLPYLQRETDYPPWYAADRFISILYGAFGPFNVELKQFVRTLSEQFYDAFQVPDNGIIPFEELFQRYSRELALKLACNAGNERCLADTFNVNRNFIENGRAVPKGLEGVVLCSGFRGTGKQTQWSALYQTLQTTTDTTLRSQILNGLGCTDDTDSLRIYLESIVAEGNTYTENERWAVLNAVLNSQSGLQAVVNFIRDFESDILEYTTLEDLLRIPAATIKTEEQKTIFENFLATITNLDGASRGRITAIVDNNFAVQQQYETSIAFIRQYLYQQTSTVEQTEPTTVPPETTVPPTSPPTDPTTTESPETTTPSGAASMGIQFATIFASIVVAVACKI
ncbi:putative aminopeptidase-2 [Bradysia coprophila]|uniref:putative aminopeptidase-2 n=1 Tax=Bradysia coprophila TaxID=38358 RepID=UPI00187DB889|nr:putative aminopeptidase-2 [Bradysia coprophila]